MTMTMTMTDARALLAATPIARELIEEARIRGACNEGMQAAQACASWAEFVRHSEFAEWAATEMPLPDQIAEGLHALGFGRSWWRDGKRHREGVE